MNNKGMTLVELLVTFSLLLVLIVGMFNLILEVKFQLDEKQIAKDLTEYSATINNEIHYDLLRNKPFAIAYKTSYNGDWTCKNNSKVPCSEDSSIEYNFKSGSKSVTKTSTDLDGLCSNVYPCAVYAYVSGEDIKFKTIALGNGTYSAEIEDEATKNILNNPGIYYNDVYESVPNPEFIEIRGERVLDEKNELVQNSGQKLEIKLENNLFIINFPVYIIENDKNYGFKIVYPFVTDIDK